MFDKRFVTYSLLTLYFLIEKVENKCDNIHASLSQKVLNEGFHREIQYTIDLVEQNGLDFWSHGGCRLAIGQKLPSGAYVNSDELQDLRRLNKVHACPVGSVDVEKPKHMSRPIMVHIYSPLNSSHLTVTFPIHLRYHRAKSKGGYEIVKIGYPLMLLRCPNNVFKLCESIDTITAPCAACSPHKCSWHNITIKHLTGRLEMFVPVGDLNDTLFVTIVTFLACFSGCFYIILILNRTSGAELKSKLLAQQKEKKEG